MRNKLMLRLSLLGFSLLLISCGQKGPLYLPNKPCAISTPTQSVPAQCLKKSTAS